MFEERDEARPSMVNLKGRNVFPNPQSKDLSSAREKITRKLKFLD